LFGRRSDNGLSSEIKLKKLKKLLKITALEIKKNKYKKFYKVSSKEILPAFGNFIFSIDSSVNLMQSSLSYAEQSIALKTIIIERHLTESQKEIISLLTKEYLLNENAELKKIGEQNTQQKTDERIKMRVNELYARFDNEWCYTVNTEYRQTVSFIWFVCFDYLTILRTMYPSYVQNSMQNIPHFLKIKSKLICAGIKDFLAIAENLLRYKDWNNIFKILHSYNTHYLISESSWKDMLKNLNSVLGSHILSLIVSHSEDNPEWQNNPVMPNNKIAEAFIGNVSSGAQEAMDAIVSEIKQKKISEIILKIFDGSSAPVIAKNFNQDILKNIPIDVRQSVKDIDAYNWMLSFDMLNFRVINDICDFLIVYGEWNDRAYCTELSSTLQELVDANLKLTEFDKDFSEDGYFGSKLKIYKKNMTQGAQKGDALIKLMQKADTYCKEVVSDELMQLKKTVALLSRCADFSSDKILGIIKNRSVIQKIFSEKHYNINDLSSKIEMLSKLMNHTGFILSPDGDDLATS
jgi:hypothetical protein